MKPMLCAVLLTILTAAPAAAQMQAETPSDRYTRDPAQERPRDLDDQQAQARDRRRQGEVQDLRRDHMNSPNVKGQRVPEDTETGVPEPQQRDRTRNTEGGIRP